jgi:hypothetical protein
MDRKAKGGFEIMRTYMDVTNNECAKIDHSNDSAVTLSADELDDLLMRFSERAKQIRRFVGIVGTNPNRPTTECNRFSAACNLSDLRQKYNKTLRGAGYELRCKVPTKPILNGYGENSGQFLWALYPAMSS